MSYEKILNFISDRRKNENISEIEIKDFSQGFEERNIHAIDGGNAVIIDGGTWIISKIRIANVLYNKNRISENHNDYLIANTEKEIESSPKSEIALPKKIEISEIANHFRKIKECEEIIKIIEEAKAGSIILCDFLFLPENEIIKSLIDEMIKKSDEKEVILVGIGKTSRANMSGNSLIGFFNSINEKKKNPWYSVLVPKNNYHDLVVKLHSNSRYTYRIHTNSKEFEKFLPILSFYSSDPAIPGYPFPLIRADKVARITDNERLLEKAEIGRHELYKKIRHDEKSMDFHERLDEHAHK